MYTTVGGTFHRTFSEATGTCPKCRRRLWDQCKKLFWEHSKELFGRRKPFAATTPEDKRAPRPLQYYGCRPKANTVGEEKQKKIELRTSLKKRWGNLPQNLLARQNGSAPEDQEDHETWSLVEAWFTLGGTLVKPCWNLPRKLLAAQDRSAPENYRESESNSAPKPLLWLKTPKLFLLGNQLLMLMSIVGIKRNKWGKT